MLQMILQKRGYNSCQCIDGHEAIQLVTTHGIDYFDVIFMDSVMPNVTGPEATRQLRSLGYNHLIIGVTGNAIDIDVLEFEQAGANVVLSKPLRTDLLFRILDYCYVYGHLSTTNHHINSSSHPNTPTNNTNNNSNDNMMMMKTMMKISSEDDALSTTFNNDFPPPTLHAFERKPSITPISTPTNSTASCSTSTSSVFLISAPTANTYSNNSMNSVSSHPYQSHNSLSLTTNTVNTTTMSLKEYLFNKL
jgi:CheY-like chemotaxis protein